MREGEREREKRKQRNTRNYYHCFTAYFTSFAFFSLHSLSLSLYIYKYVHHKTTASSKEKDELLAHMQANKRALCANVTVKKAITVCSEERERERFPLFSCICIYVQSCDSYIDAFSFAAICCSTNRVFILFLSFLFLVFFLYMYMYKSYVQKENGLILLQTMNGQDQHCRVMFVLMYDFLSIRFIFLL
jgi:hypothetical protein